MPRRRSRSGGEVNVWPAFVDVLATLLLVIILLVMVVSITQFYTANRAQNAEDRGELLKDFVEDQQRQINDLEAARLALLDRLNVQMDELNILGADRDAALESAQELLAKLATAEGEGVDLNISLTAAFNQVEAKLDRLLAVLANQRAENATLADQNQELTDQNADLSGQVATLNNDLDSLGERINDSLLLEAEELQRQRSVFFGTLLDVLGERDDISVVGDRFVFQSEVLFDTGSADIGAEGQAQLAQLATTILSVAEDFPDDLDWILRIDGHTDARAIAEDSQSGFENNWQLSSERARSVVQYLVARGVPPQRLAAAGFGEHQPLNTGSSEQAYAQNRRIEIKLTTR